MDHSRINSNGTVELLIHRAAQKRDMREWNEGWETAVPEESKYKHQNAYR